MKVFLNGESRDLLEARTVAHLVEELELPAPTLLIEHNGTALRRDEWNARTLSEGDHLEIMRISAGG